MNRKEKIAHAALYLFAEKGYENTSTQLIGQNAEVSEALIFKHFGNKENLLHHIVKNRICPHYSPEQGYAHRNRPSETDT